jgi:hypothetical protein
MGCICSCYTERGQGASSRSNDLIMFLGADCEVYDCSIVERRLICAVVAAMNGQVKRVSSLSNGAHFLEQEVSASLYNHIRFLLLLYSLSH